MRVDSARDQAVILMTSRGPACRELVEPKLADLNRNFHKVAQHINSAQVRRQRLSRGLNGACFSAVDRRSLASTKYVCCVQVSAGLEVRQEAVRPPQEVADGRSAPVLSSSQLQLFESDLQATIRALEQQEKTHTPDDERVHTPDLTRISYTHLI